MITTAIFLTLYLKFEEEQNGWLNLVLWLAKPPTYPNKHMRVVIHSFDVFEVLILQFDKGLSILNFSRSSVLLFSIQL